MTGTIAAESASPRRRRQKRVRPIPRVLLTKEEAGDALGMSVDSFERYVQPHIGLVRIGSMVLVPVAELQRWADENTARILD